MSQFILGTDALALYNYIPIRDAESSPLWKTRYAWEYQRRGLTIRDQSNFFDLWPSARIQCGDPTAPATLIGQDGRDGGQYEDPEYGPGGSFRPYFIVGQVVSAGLTPVGGANVQGFLTASDVTCGQITTDSNGNYQLPTIYVGQAHYLVAYLPGSPDTAGTTVDTLIPTQ